MCVVALFLAVFLTPAGSEGARKILTVGTAPAGTGSFPFMVAVATLVNKHVKELALSPQESGGAVGNLRELAAGRLQIATTSAIVNAKARLGKAPFKKKVNVQILFTMFGQRLVYFGRQAAGVKSWDDLKGKRMILGAPGGSTRVLGQLIAKTKGLNKGNYTPLFLRWGAMINALKDGRADGGYGLIQGNSPTPATMEIGSTLPVNIFGVDEATIKKAMAVEPGLSKGVVPAKTFPRQTNSVVTVAEYLQVGVLSNSVTEKEAYLVTKTVLENYKRLGRFAPAARGWTPKTAVEGLEGVTIHAGSLRYLKEKGLIK
jgi:TRAP transporter TAXI family solute receptor